MYLRREKKRMTVDSKHLFPNSCLKRLHPLRESGGGSSGTPIGGGLLQAQGHYPLCSSGFLSLFPLMPLLDRTQDPVAPQLSFPPPQISSPSSSSPQNPYPYQAGEVLF